jgi:predicted 3-demethylubiquinone-9 3-methyltransferase (glyoxalase superfamily)
MWRASICYNGSMKKIIPHLWFDKEAKEAAAFYTSIFDNSKVTSTSMITNTPSGDCDIVNFELRGQPFMAISAGPYFKFNPSISFMVSFDPSQEKDADKNIDAVWNKLLEGGTALMPIDKYPFAERYGWVQDKYGLTWQLILVNPEGEERPGIVPSMIFVGEKFGQAEEAINFYLSVFKNSPSTDSTNSEQAKLGTMVKYPAGSEPNKEGTVMFADFKLLGTWFAAMDGAGEHKYSFNEAVSFIVSCDTQEEIDYYSEKLSAVPEAEQCGWLKDKFGVSWQIVPSAMNEMMGTNDKAALDRVTSAFLKMKRFDIAELEKAFKG